MGLNFVPTSRRVVTAEEARALLPRLGACVAVGVFRGATVAQIEATAAGVGLGWVQLHGDEPPDDCARLRASGLRVIKALTAGPDLGARSDRYARVVDWLLLDAAEPGSGRPWDWGTLAAFRPPCPWLLAGGLTPDNVAAAIATARPDGVDVASGIEREGLPCPGRIEAFCGAARGTPG